MADLVLIPGLNNTGAVFDGVAAALPASILAHAPTLPALDRVEALADELAERLPERFWLAGFSFGGYVALALLERHRPRVQGIALLCTSPLADTAAQRRLRRAAQAAAQAGDYQHLIARQAAHAFHPDSLGNAALMQTRRDMVDAYGPTRYVAHLEATLQRPDRRWLLDGSMPTLVVSASHDAVFAPATVQAWADGIAGAQYVCVQGAGHLAPLEKSAELAAHLAMWVGH